MIDITLNKVSKIFSSGEGTTTALNNICALIPSNSFTAIIGKSGSGKTTLLNLIATLDHPTSGSIQFNDICLKTYTDAQLDLLRNETIGFVFQQFFLLPDFTALENIMLPYFIRHQNKEEAIQKSLDLLEQFQLTHRQNSYPSQLSGGEQQRIAICRAIINKPQIILADEPTGNLDAYHQNFIMDILLSLHKDLNCSLIVVTHNQDLTIGADQILKLDFGSLI